VLDIEHYLSLRQKPKGLKVMYHKWRDLSFLHFPIDAAELRSVVPEELEIDTFPDANGVDKAWVGLVPFWMTGVRVPWLPAIPGLSTFPETNLRTYVHRKGTNPGVWFFSLDAANRIACAAARKTYGLPYFWASMRVHRDANKINYESRRRSSSEAFCKMTTLVGEEMGEARPGTLEFFLVERYLLFSKFRGQIVTAQVHHKPYQLNRLSVLSYRQTICEADGVPDRPMQHFLYSPGVDVEVYAVQKTRD